VTEDGVPWAYNSERLKIFGGITGDAQEGSFMNATLQSTGNDPNLEFSVAVHVEIPAAIETQEQLMNFLGGIFGEVIYQQDGLHVEIQLGPAEDGRDYAEFMAKKQIGELELGTEITLAREVWRYPHFEAEEGLTGKLSMVDPEQGIIEVTMDKPLPGAEDWKNAIQWSDDDYGVEFLKDVGLLADDS
jgi:hypothetical protein